MDGTVSLFERWYSAVELAGLPGLPGTERRVREKAAREKWEFRERSGHGGGREYSFKSLPDAAQEQLELRNRPVVAVHPAAGNPDYKRGHGEVRHVTAEECREAQVVYATKLTDKRRVVAVQRWEALHEVLALRDAGVPLMRARQQVAQAKQAAGVRGCSVCNLIRYQQKIGDAPRSDWLALLADHHLGKSAGPAYYKAACDAVCWEWWRDHYLSRARPSYEDAYRRLREMADAQGWRYPSLDTLKRRLKREVPYREQVVRREGPMAIRRLLPVQIRDALCFAAGQAVNGDGVTLDPMWITFKDGERVKGGKLWVWQDIRTRRYLAWRLGKTENTDVFRLATYDLTAVCAPDHVWIDNTRAAANKTMTAGAKHRHRFKSDPEDGEGLLRMLGMEPHFTDPDKETGNPGSKPIERSFGIGGLPKMVLANPRIVAAGGGLTEATAVDVALVCEVLDEEIARFNAQLGRRTQACNGALSFDQAWDEGLKGYVPRVLTAEQRQVLLMSREVVRINTDRGQFTLKAGNAPYGLRNGYWNGVLSGHHGERVVVLYDPENLHADVSVHTLKGELICTAECVHAAAFKSEDSSRNHKKHRVRQAKALKQAAKAGETMDAIERAELWELARDNGEVAVAAAAEPAAGAGGRVVKGHFKQVPKAGRKGSAQAGDAEGDVLAFPVKSSEEAAAMEQARQALEDYTERLFREQQAGIL